MATCDGRPGRFLTGPGVASRIRAFPPLSARVWNTSVPTRGIIRRLLLAGVACSVLLPIVLAVVIGLGVLLQAVGDGAGGRVCGRAALVVGVCWLVAIITTAVASGAALLDDRTQPADHDGPPRP